MQIEKKRNAIEFKISGMYAMFADPITRIGGEKCSYQIPTYEAIKGITESVYWKPTLVWIVDSVRVMRKIQTESKGVKTLQMNGIYPSLKNPAKKEPSIADLSYYTYLRDVEYQVLAHFEWNLHYPELEKDRNENKHHNIARRCVEKGGRRDIFLGTRECQGYVEPCVFGEGKGFYDGYGDINFGLQFHGFDYPNETGVNELWKRLWWAKMHNGVIEFPRPEECPPEMRSYIHKMGSQQFVSGKGFALVGNDNSLVEMLKGEE